MDPRARRAAIQASIGGGVLLALFVGMSLTSSGPPEPETAADPESATAEVPATEPTAVEVAGPEDPDGCFSSGSTRAEVSRVMGAPDSIAFGEWLYGRSGVTFGYGTVLDYHNEGGDLRLCP
jgi:hypothetical protein